MTSALERYARWLVVHPWQVLALVLVATLALASGMRHLRSEFSVEASLPARHDFVRIDRAIRAEFGGRRAMVLAVVARDGDVWRPAVLAVVRDLTRAVLHLPDVMPQNVVSLAAPGVRHVEDRGGVITADYLMRDVPRTAAELAQLRARVEADPQLRGMLVTPDQRAALVLVDFFEGPESWELAHRVLDLTAAYRDHPVDVYVAGEPMVAATDRGQSALAGRRFPLTFAVIALLLLLSFRNLQGMLIPMLTATLTTAWAFGFMGHMGIAIDSWNAASPFLLVAVAAAHSAQMLKRYVEELTRTGDNAAAVVAATVAMGPVMIAAGATAALGFLSLALFGVRSITNLGLVCGFGIASAVLLELTFIPALRALLPAPRRRHTPEGGVATRILAMLQRAVVRSRGRAVLLGTGLVLALALAGMMRLRGFGPTREYMPATSPGRVHLEAIERHFPGTVTMTVLYEGAPGSMRTVGAVRHMAALQDELAADPLVVRTASLADLVKMLHQTFNADAPEPYRVPDEQELLAQLLYLGESPAFERFTNRAQDKAVVLAWLRSDDPTLVGPLVRRAQQWVATHPPPGGVSVLVAGGAGPTVLAFNEHTTQGKLLNMGLVLAGIYVVSSIIMRSAAVGLYVVTPIVVTIVILFGALGWSGVRLDMGSSSVIAMAAGIGADYAIYFLYRLREERRRLADDGAAVGAALQTSGRAALFVATSIGAGFAVMAVSPYLGMRLFGTLMPAAMGISCLASLTLMPVLVLRARPRFIFDAAAEPVRRVAGHAPRRRTRIAIVGAGASGTALAWCLARGARAADREVVVFHDEPELGGHSHTIPVTVDGATFGVDIGVQYVTPTLYPNLFSMLALDDFRGRVEAERVGEIRFAASFTPELNFGNFSRYAEGSRFARLARDEVRAHAHEFVRDVRRALWGRLDGRRLADMPVEAYLDAKPHLRDGDFARFVLVPLLSVMNGYTAYDLLAPKLAELWPLCARFPFLDGPLLGFDRPHRGWYRFRDGAQRWVEAMADLARARGVRFRAASPVTRVCPRPGGGADVVFEADGRQCAETFDEVVFTTDMQTNEALLAHADNPLWERQAARVGVARFPTLPGVCFIHRDESILSPHTRDLQPEDVQFNSAYAWAPERSNPYGLPYDLHATYATHLVHSSVPGAPRDLYVTMYAEAQGARWPASHRVLHRKDWRHGRWLSSYFADAKASLHQVQGLGGLWFAGNPSTFDAEEGALLSAIGVAERLADDCRYPFGGMRGLRRPHAAILYKHFVRGIMFPDAWERPRADAARRAA